MALPELVTNSPVPGTKTPISTLTAAISTTPAALTIETWTSNGAAAGAGSPFVAAPPAALLQPGQFRFQIDSEICLDITGSNAANRQVMRGVEGSPVATHAAGASVFHYLTAAALQNLLTQNQPALGTFQAHASATAQLGSGALAAKVALNAIDYDISGWFNTASNRFQPAQAGYYHIDAGVYDTTTGLASGDFTAIYIYKNGALIPSGVGAAQATAANATMGAQPNVAAVVYLNGTTDYVELWGYCVTAGNAQVAAPFGGWMTGFMAAGIGSASTAQGRATTARAYRATALAVTASTWTKIPLDTVSYDPGANMPNASTGVSDATAAKGRYICPATGYYQVSGAVLLVGYSAIYKNGALVVQSGSNATNQSFTEANDIIQCNAGDYLELWGYATSGGITPGATYAYMSVGQVGGTNLIGALSPTAQTAAFTASAGQCVLMTGANPVTLPPAPQAGSVVQVMALTGTVAINRSGTDTITIPNGGSPQAGQTTVAIGVGTSITLQYFGGVWSQVAGGQPILPSPWIAPTGYTNSWGSYTGPGFMKDAQGFVHMRGLIAGGASGSAAFTLPVGYRPGVQDLYSAVGNTAAACAVAAVSITAAGVVTPVFPAAIQSLGLGGISFLAEN